MDDRLMTLILAATTLVAYQVFVTVRLVRFGGYSNTQKVAQTMIIWALPLIGALIVYSVLSFTVRGAQKADENFIPHDSSSV